MSVSVESDLKGERNERIHEERKRVVIVQAQEQAPVDSI